MTPLARLMAEIKTWLPPDIALGGAEIVTGDDHGLFPEELDALARAVPRRRAEFAAGRRAARAAMGELGLAEDAIPMAPSRAPVWPQGVVGTITHAEGVALALVARGHGYHGLGLDIEPATPLPSDLAEVVLTPAEQLDAGKSADPALWAKRVFSAKEAAYKCQYARTGKLLEFSAVEISIEVARLQARFTLDCPPYRKGQSLTGWTFMSEGFVITCFTDPAERPADGPS